MFQSLVQKNNWHLFFIFASGGVTNWETKEFITDAI